MGAQHDGRDERIRQVAAETNPVPDLDGVDLGIEQNSLGWIGAPTAARPRLPDAIPDDDIASHWSPTCLTNAGGMWSIPLLHLNPLECRHDRLAAVVLRDGKATPRVMQDISPKNCA